MDNTLGRHILVEFFGCSSEILNDVISIEEQMVNAAKEAQATVINSTFHHFSPYGVSGVVVIQESHLAIHTWPEYRYAAVDLFTCGTEVDPWIAYDYLKKALEATYGSAMEMKRGAIDLLERVDTKALEIIRKDREDQHTEPRYKRDVWFTDKDENIALSIRHTGNRLYRKKSEYQTVEVLETHAYGKMLTIDNIVMTTEKDEFIYHEMISHVALLSNPKIKKVLVIGGGDGGTIREVLRHEHLEQVTMVEIDENVIEAAKLHLPTISTAFDHPKLQLLIYDGIKYLANCPAETFDLIIVDGSDPLGPAEGLFSASFYQNAYRCLTNDGVLALQSEGPHFNREAFIDLNYCLKNIFGQDQVHCYLAYIPTYPTGMWSFHYASKGSVHPTKDLEESVADAFVTKHDLQYYNSGVHRAAFALPNFVAKMLSK
ncbi:MAG: polyamine aminopropyltransferase [Saprospiraceae bacterium]|nr:polyamine aminopropyltransferase [Saprospiraceae bacterium]